MCINIPASPAYSAYISHLIRYTRASSNYSDFLKRHLYQTVIFLHNLISNEMLNEVMSKPRLLNPYLYTFSRFTL
jgi:hypothetical protein